MNDFMILMRDPINVIILSLSLLAAIFGAGFLILIAFQKKCLRRFDAAELSIAQDLTQKLMSVDKNFARIEVQIYDLIAGTEKAGATRLADNTLKDEKLVIKKLLSKETYPSSGRERVEQLSKLGNALNYFDYPDELVGKKKPANKKKPAKKVRKL